MTFRAIDKHQIVFGHQPFAGGAGHALYVGGDDPANNPGPEVILYDRGYLFDGHQFVSLGNLQFGGANVTKTRAVAFVKNPTAEFDYELPAELLDATVWAQVRPHAGGVELPTIFRPVKLAVDSGGDQVDKVEGTGRVTGITKLAGGGFEFRFRWTNNRNGETPTQFRLTKTAGPGTVADVIVTCSAGESRYKLEVTGLADAQSYTFHLQAENGSATRLLYYQSSTDIVVTADASGPPAPTGLSLTAS